MWNRSVIQWSAGSLLAAVLLTGGLIRLAEDRRENAGMGSRKSLQIWCAAGLKGPLDELASQYEQARGTQVILQYGGSGTLLASIESTKSGDVFIPADAFYATLAREKGLGGEGIELATTQPVLAVVKGNPRNVRGWRDLLDRPDLNVGLCHPGSAAIGMTVQSIARSRGDWESLQAATDVMKSTVSELALDLKAGALDAAFLWDQTAASVSGLETVPCPELSGRPAIVPAMVLSSSKSPESALDFVRWIASPESGAPVFRRHHFMDAP